MKNNGLSWKIGGEAGYGIMTTGLIFAKICSRAGLHVFDHTEYPSLVRGGHNTYQVRADADEVFSIFRSVDLLIALNKETIDKHVEELTSGGGIIYDEEKIPLSKDDVGRKDVTLYPVPLNKLAEESGGRKIMINSVALGSSVALTNFNFEMLSDVIQDVFKRKTKETIQYNIRAARLGYDYIKRTRKDRENMIVLKLPKIDRKRMLLTGNEAVSLGAIKAGCKFFAAYPMTPASSILHFMAAQERKFDIVVKHTEDEIAAITMVIGASFAGARAMTATSGGGFSLMCEALGLAAMTETPFVVVLCQRPGPSTGLPTRTEQGDLKFVLNASQGDFPRFVIAPGDVEECFYKTIEAFNLAEKYQCPVITILDKYLSRSHKTTEKFMNRVEIDRGLLLSDEALAKIQKFQRYEFTETGISPRTIPSQKGGIFTATGNEHDETGYISEDKTVRIKMMDKRFKKFELAEKEILEPKLFGSKDAEVTIISWGSTKGPIKEGIKLLDRDGIKANFLQIIYVSPFPTNKVSKIIESSKKTVIVENNKTAQMAGLIREKTGEEIEHKILKYDGRQFYPTEIYQLVKEVL
ncbi:2-oxoacid:acceptor oxidoreductase subunit alpha [Candidatus Bathyarchaeota archaeon]|nr:2-oxoacid:acceptor oxidoreductase subunit alpha [Candidatus Bathyarchaeota archaeon]